MVNNVNSMRHLMEQFGKPFLEGITRRQLMGPDHTEVLAIINSIKATDKDGAMREIIQILDKMNLQNNTEKNELFSKLITAWHINNPGHRLEEAEGVSEIIVQGFGSWDERTLRRNINERIRKIMLAAKDENFGNVANDAAILKVQAAALKEYLEKDNDQVT